MSINCIFSTAGCGRESENGFTQLNETAEEKKVKFLNENTKKRKGKNKNNSASSFKQSYYTIVLIFIQKYIPP